MLKTGHVIIDAKPKKEKSTKGINSKKEYVTRKEFIKACGLLGISLPFQSFIVSNRNNLNQEFKGKVIVIGAGAAGLSAGYLLKQEGIDFEILEASSTYGGRMKVNTSFADFPIALGAEWISSTNLQFEQLVGKQESLKNIQTVNYLPTDEYGVWNNGKLIIGTIDTFTDKKFVNSSWLSFFEEFVLPTVKSKITYNSAIKTIDYTNSAIVLKTNEEEFEADKVILTTPASIIKSGDIFFEPALPNSKTKALSKTQYWDGFKAFFEFEKKFYPSFVDYLIHPETDGQLSFYDAAWGQNSDKNILGLFSVGVPARKYGEQEDAEFIEKILEELDAIFEDQASKNYLKHITQKWTDEPLSKGAYVSDFTDPKTIAKLQQTINNQVFFAGDGYTNGKDWGNVHNAIHSARQCVSEILKRT